MIDWLKMTLMERSNVFQLDFWDEFIQTKDFRDIQTYISKEYDVFKVYFDSIYDKLSKSKNIPEIIQPIMNTNYK